MIEEELRDWSKAMMQPIKKFIKEIIKEPWIITSWMVMIGAMVAYVWGSV